MRCKTNNRTNNKTTRDNQLRNEHFKNAVKLTSLIADLKDCNEVSDLILDRR